MKKIISMGIASAVLALTAIAASADITATGAAEVETGKTVEVVITTTADTETYGVNLAADGLEFVEAKGLKSDFDIVAPQADGSINFTGVSMSGYKAGDVLGTFVFTVTAAKDADVNIALSPMSEGDSTVLVSYTAKVVDGAATDPTDPADPTDPTDPTQPENPDTGVALAIVPAVIAGAAVVVAKKRK